MRSGPSLLSSVRNGGGASLQALGCVRGPRFPVHAPASLGVATIVQSELSAAACQLQKLWDYVRVHGWHSFFPKTTLCGHSLEKSDTPTVAPVSQ